MVSIYKSKSIMNLYPGHDFVLVEELSRWIVEARKNGYEMVNVTPIKKECGAEYFTLEGFNSRDVEEVLNSNTRTEFFNKRPQGK